MEVDIKYHPENCVSDDETRYVITHLNVRESHPEMPGAVIEATNGSELVAVPVLLESGDLPGLLRKEVFQLARKQLWMRKICITLKKKWAHLRDHTICLRSGLSDKRTFPDTETCEPAGDPEPLKEICLNADRLANIQHAIGTPAVRLIFHGKHEPIKILPKDSTLNRAYGILMPVRMEEDD